MPKKFKVKALTANPRDPVMVGKVITVLEGVLQELRDAKPTERDPEDRRPKAMPVQYIASHLGCSVGALKRWYALHLELRKSEELSDLFVDVYGRIANELAEVISSKTFSIAANTENPQSLSAQKWLLPKMLPEVYGDFEVDISTEDDGDIIGTDVMEALTVEERERIAELDAEIEARNREVDGLLSKAKRAVRADEI